MIGGYGMIICTDQTLTVDIQQTAVERTAMDDVVDRKIVNVERERNTLAHITNQKGHDPSKCDIHAEIAAAVKAEQAKVVFEIARVGVILNSESLSKEWWRGYNYAMSVSRGATAESRLPVILEANET